MPRTEQLSLLFVSKVKYLFFTRTGGTEREREVSDWRKAVCYMFVIIIRNRLDYQEKDKLNIEKNLKQRKALGID